MKKGLLFFLVVSSATINAQSISPEIISATGDFYSNSSAMISFTEGEPYGETISGGSSLITEGFEQPDIAIVSIRNELSSGASVFPNPCNGTFKISTTNFTVKKIEVLNILGEKIYNASSAMKEIEIELHSPPGVYFVQINGAEGFYIEKIVVQ